MRMDSPLARIVAAALVVCVQVLFIPIARAADPPAALTGTVLSSPSGGPLAGARVLAGDRTTGEITRSEPTGPDGAFRIGPLAAETYELAVESGNGLYVVQSPVRLKPGESRDVQLMVGSAAPDAGAGTNTGTNDEKHKRRAAGFWENPVTATLIVLGAAVIVGIVVDQATSEEAPASPASPL